MNMDMFDHRDDNVARQVKKLSYKLNTPAQGVSYNVAFNINQVEFVSRLNTQFHEALRTHAHYQDLVKMITKDYSVSKRQYAFYLLDCYDETLRELCTKVDIGAMQVALNKEFGNQMFVGILLDEASS